MPVDNRMCLKKRIGALDFALLEMEMYLDTHPENQKALQARQIYRQKKAALVAEYEKMYGPYVATTSDIPGDIDRWIWINGPWPWELTKEG